MRFIDWLIDELQCTPAKPAIRDYEVGVYMTRSLTERFVRQLRW